MYNHKEVIRFHKRNGCIVCSENSLVCLTFHHVIPEHKEFTIGRMSNTDVNLETLEQEIDKCVCFCRNCHAKYHSGFILLPEWVLKKFGISN